jgi:hypothetical protein
MYEEYESLWLEQMATYADNSVVTSSPV